MKLSSIHPNPKNPRRITQQNADRLIKSIEQLPQMMNLRPIVVDENGVILGGNMRFLALKRSGYKDIPDNWVRRADDLTEQQKREFIINDNAGFGEWDWDALGNEWDDLPLADWGLDVPEDWAGPGAAEPSDAEPQIDRAAELNKKWQVKAGDLWKIGDHRLLCGDSTDRGSMTKLMREEIADCVFTSPPYGVGVDYRETYQDTIDNLRAMLPVLAYMWIDHVRPGGFAVVNFGDIVSASKIVGTDGPCEYPMALEYWPAFRAAGWVLWSRRIWCKPGAGTGSMQCISSNRAATNWEHIWTWRKDGEPIFQKQTTGKYPSQNGWIDSTRSEGLAVGLKDHGAGMPPLPAMFSVSNHSLAGGIVIDPFCGTGTTMVACQNLNRKCRGMEINSDYCAVILERMVTAFPEIKIERANA